MDEPADLHLPGRRAQLVGGLVAHAHGVEPQLLQAGFEVERDGFRGALREHHFEDLGDDLTGLLDADRIALADVLAGDLSGVVQRGAGHGGAGEEHGLELGHGGDRAGPADLHRDRAQHGIGAVRRELEGHGPVRELARPASLLLIGQAVDLDHGAIGREGQLAAQAVELLERRPGRLDPVLHRDIVARRETPFRQPAFEVGQRGEDRRLAGAQAVAQHAQAALPRLRVVEQFDRAGCQVAWVGVERLALGLAFGVQALEFGQLHVDLAADLEQLGGVGQLARQGFDEGDVVGDIIAAVAVAAGDRADEATALVGEGEGDPVDLGLHHEVDLAGPKGLLEPLAESPEIPLVIGIVQREHRLAMVALLEPFGPVVPDPQFRPRVLLVFTLQLAQPGHQFVELEVGDLGGVLAAIQVLMLRDQAAQVLDLLEVGFLRHGRRKVRGRGRGMQQRDAMGSGEGKKLGRVLNRVRRTECGVRRAAGRVGLFCNPSLASR